MIYPKLVNTPIKEIIFSISYDEIVYDDCFNKFVELDLIKKVFPDINPSITGSIKIASKGELTISRNHNGFHLKNDKEVLQMKTGSFSYHFLNDYCDFDKMCDSLMNFWISFNEIVEEGLTITSISVRYINVLEINDENPASRIIQLYPKHSSDRNILNFQNSVSFKYLDFPNSLVNIVSTKPKDDKILLDISVIEDITKKLLKVSDLKKLFKPLQEIKNKAFFDSITAKALIRYINQKQ